jgi:hypothetical protein
MERELRNSLQGLQITSDDNLLEMIDLIERHAVNAHQCYAIEILCKTLRNYLYGKLQKGVQTPHD